MTKANSLLIDRQGGVLSLMINDAPLNRMSFAFMDELENAIEDAARDPKVRALVFTASGDVNFSVGMDLKQMMNEGGDRGGWNVVLDQRRRVLGRIESLNKPSIATMFGYCLGGGLELPLACHFRLAADTNTQIGLPEMELGTIPAWGGTARLTRCVGRDRALDMVLRARKIDGPEALRIGLVQSIHPTAELKAAAFKLANELAALPPLAVEGAIRCIVGAGEKSLSDALDVERHEFLRCASSNDQAEGLKAFMEKRKPMFTGT